ncbi:long-chain fatty acid transporter fat1 [Clarireedia jacksonii]
MPVPLAVAAPAALAGLAYLNAKLSLGNDYRVLGGAVKANVILNRRAKQERLNMFYILEEHALGKFSNDTFLIFDGRSWTYKEVYDVALKYGTWLKNTFDIKPKEIVAMDLMNSEKFLFIWFGLWSIGAKPAFINYNLTDKALSHCVETSTARICIVDPEIQHNVTQEVRDALPDVTFQIFTAEVEAAVISTEGIKEPDSSRIESNPADIGILIYTSGTTGLPKPAIVSWKKANVASILVSRWYGHRRTDVLYTCMPLYHSAASVLAVCTTLAVGATVCIGRKFSTSTFWKEVRESNATIIQYVGETCRYLLSAPPQYDPVTGENLDKKNSVRMAFGNGLRPDVWNRFKERFDIDTIAEFYSATESSGGSWNYSRNDFSKGAVGRNGFIYWLLLRKGWAVVELDIETELPVRSKETGFCKKVKYGEPGEMLYKLDAADIAASFQGYFNNAGSSESKVLRDVFEKGDAWFRTGDVMTWDAEGRVWFNDRIGDTFRWKSENVSTNEVSEVLSAHPAIEEANVYGVELPHHDGRAGCVAIILKSESKPEQVIKDLAAFARKGLPSYAVPVFLRVKKETMELTGTIKMVKHVVRKQGVDPEQMNGDELWWLKNGEYVPFTEKEWAELNGGSVKL